MLNTFAAGSRAILLGGLLVTTLASCATLSPRTALPLHIQLAETSSPDGAERVNAWLELRDSLGKQKTLSELSKVERVNTFFNSLAWLPDDENWGMEDYWATPLETLLRGAGDCEDLAIAKYFTLLDVGVDEDRLRLSYVWRLHEGGREAHLVLAYYPETGSEPWILDNLAAEALALSEREDLEKVYSFNRWNLWLAGNAQQALSIASQDRLINWRQVNERMDGESQQFTAAVYWTAS